MQPEILLITPPLTQLNTPYPATAYLSGFLKTKGIPFRQADLGLDFVLAIFNNTGLSQLFDAIEKGNFELSIPNANILGNRKAYENSIDAVIAFLQNRNYTLAYRVARGNYLPEGPRFKQLEDPKMFFGSIGIQDQARYLCSMYLEDLSDLIQASISPHFGFSKYAERIGRTAVSFDPIRKELETPLSYLDAILISETKKYFSASVPSLVALSVPFPGNLYGALKMAQWIKANYPETAIAMGGGYANTELRELNDSSVFDFVDFICLDDGESPLLSVYEHLINRKSEKALKRTFLRIENKVKYLNNYLGLEINHSNSATPSYEGLRLNDYLSMYDVPNPMHRLWNDGRWNKLTIAHGCYWKKCSFCDISLDYISRYEQAPAKLLVDKMEQLIAETGETGFHFVDEAAPPAAMRDLALEILSRKLQVTWWTNIRFEKTFTPDLCKLLAASGCVAVTGGLEVASDRLLALMEKGVTVEQVATVCRAFRDSGILVHAYLMYGFPTETEQETIDSLEVVRQMFALGLLQSAYWHRFAMTVHSPVGKNPEKYDVIRTGPEFKGFANNDLYHDDPKGADHSKYTDGLNKALYNYMHGKELNSNLQKFFHFRIPSTTHSSNLISKYIKIKESDVLLLKSARIIFNFEEVKELKRQENEVELLFISTKDYYKILFPSEVAKYIMNLKSEGLSSEIMLADLLKSLEDCTGHNNEFIMHQAWWKKFRDLLLLIR